MKSGWLILYVICLVFITIQGMEKGSRELKQTTCFESEITKKIDALLYIIESETTYPNPDAPYRIDAAGYKLLVFSYKIVAQKWTQSCANSNAMKLVANSKKVMKKHNGTSLEVSGQMLYMQAELISLAICGLNEKIKLLK
ncbi:hypothetical protein BH09DEP1_BH09DEP1_1910 [soil metagenome]